MRTTVRQHAKYVAASAWATLDEVRSLADEPVTVAQARAGFAYRGLGLYWQTPDPRDLPRIQHPPPAATADTRPRHLQGRNGGHVPVAVVPRLHVAMIRADVFPHHVAIVRSGERLHPIACLFDTFADMAREFESTGLRWVGEVFTVGHDVIVLGIWQ